MVKKLIKWIVVGLVLFIMAVSLIVVIKELGPAGVGMILTGWAIMLGAIYVIVKILHKLIKW